MKITAVETVHCAAFSNIVWVRLATDEGLIGLGETFRNPLAVISYVHETCAPYLLGRNPLAIEAHRDSLAKRVGNHFAGFPTRSVEVRGNSAVDIALWDLFGQAAGMPVHQMLGGAARETIKVYNTCAGAAYNATARSTSNTLLVGGAAPGGGSDDLAAQWERPGDLAESLLAEGITAMKIWPFDQFAGASRGHDITLEQIKAGARPFAEIRKAVGDRMEIMHEMHGLWSAPAACRIADALREYDLYWHEDPVPMHDFASLSQFRERSGGRVCGSENLGTRAWYKEAFGRGAIDFAHFDLGWVGGLSEGRALAALAETFERPIAPHDCTGPVVFIASVHLSMHAANALVQEMVRAYTAGFYREIVTTLPRIEAGHVHAMSGPGLGTRLRDDFISRPDVDIRRTEVGA